MDGLSLGQRIVVAFSSTPNKLNISSICWICLELGDVDVDCY